MTKKKLLVTYLSAQLTRAEILLMQIALDKDPENLHQFRVSLRRSISVMSTYVDDDKTLKKMLKPLLKSTNVLREIDVLVMGIDESKYPVLLHDLSAYRAVLYKKHWNSEKIAMHLHVLQEASKVLATVQQNIPNAMLCKTALREYGQAMALSKELTPDSKAKQIHKVRIQCKKARYTLEFIEASGLLEVAEKIKKCKNILNHFGAIQDAVNQLDLLKHFCKDCASTECDRLYKERKQELKRLKKHL